MNETLALAAAGQLALASLARAVEAAPSAAQRALHVLLDDGIAVRIDELPAYRLTDGELASHVLSLALLVVPRDRVVAIAGRANPAIEFVAEDTGTLTAVLSSRHPALLTSKAAAFLETVARVHQLRLRLMDHAEVRRELLLRPELREEMGRVRILHGTLDRSFPDRTRHGTTRGSPLGQVHPSLRRPSRRLLRSLARRHGLRSMHLFGSSVRSDFRSDSDVDVLVRFREESRPTLGSMVELENQLGNALDRDVDLVREESLESKLRERILDEAIPLL